MQFRITLAGNILLLLLAVILIIDRVYFQWYHHETIAVFGYIEIVSVGILIIYYIIVLFYKHLKK